MKISFPPRTFQFFAPIVREEKFLEFPRTLGIIGDEALVEFPGAPRWRLPAGDWAAISAEEMRPPFSVICDSASRVSACVRVYTVCGDRRDPRRVSRTLASIEAARGRAIWPIHADFR